MDDDDFDFNSGGWATHPSLGGAGPLYSQPHNTQPQPDRQLLNSRSRESTGGRDPQIGKRPADLDDDDNRPARERTHGYYAASPTFTDDDTFSDGSATQRRGQAAKSSEVLVGEVVSSVSNAPHHHHTSGHHGATAGSSSDVVGAESARAASNGGKVDHNNRGAVKVIRGATSNPPSQPALPSTNVSNPALDELGAAPQPYRNNAASAMNYLQDASANFQPVPSTAGSAYSGYHNTPSMMMGGAQHTHHNMSGYGSGVAMSGDETDINSYMQRRSGRVGGGGGGSDADTRRQKMYTKTTRVYGYRPPRLHEQRAEILREKYAAEGLSPNNNKAGGSTKGLGSSSHNGANSSAKQWDTRPTLQRSFDKKQSVFAAPPPVRGRARGAGYGNSSAKHNGRNSQNRRAAAGNGQARHAAPPKVGTAIYDDSDYDEASDDVGGQHSVREDSGSSDHHHREAKPSSYISPMVNNSTPQGSAPAGPAPSSAPPTGSPVAKQYPRHEQQRYHNMSGGAVGLIHPPSRHDDRSRMRGTANINHSLNGTLMDETAGNVVRNPSLRPIHALRVDGGGGGGGAADNNSSTIGPSLSSSGSDADSPLKEGRGLAVGQSGAATTARWAQPTTVKPRQVHSAGASSSKARRVPTPLSVQAIRNYNSGDAPKQTHARQLAGRAGVGGRAAGGGDDTASVASRSPSKATTYHSQASEPTPSPRNRSEHSTAAANSNSGKPRAYPLSNGSSSASSPEKSALVGGKKSGAAEGTSSPRRTPPPPPVVTAHGSPVAFEMANRVIEGALSASRTGHRRDDDTTSDADKRLALDDDDGAHEEEKDTAPRRKSENHSIPTRRPSSPHAATSSSDYHTPPRGEEAAAAPSTAPSTPDSIPDDERHVLLETIDSLRQLIGKMEEDLAKRAEDRKAVKARHTDCVAETIAAAATCERLKLTVKAAEKEVMLLQSKRKTAAAAMREIDVKEKQIKELERMLKAVKERFERKKNEAAAKPPSSSLSKLSSTPPPLQSAFLTQSLAATATDNGDSQKALFPPLYPPGATVKEKTRIAAGRRAKLTRQLMGLRSDKDLLQKKISENEMKNRQTQLVREMQQKRLMAEREAILVAFEKRELDAVEQQLQKLRDDHERSMAHRVRTSKQVVDQYQTDMDGLSKKVTKVKSGDTDAAKLISELNNTIARHTQDVDAAEKELSGTVATMAQLSSKVKALEADLVARNGLLQRQQRDLGDVHALHRVTTEQSKSVSTETERELKALQAALMGAIAKTEAAQQALDAAASADEKMTFKHEQLIAEHGTVEQLTNKIQDVNNAIDQLTDERGKQAAIFAENKRRQEADSLAEDKMIEHLTKGLEARKKAYAAANAKNSEMLQKLDTAERLVAMYNLKP